MASDNLRPIERFEGTGETFEDACEDAANRAVTTSAANDGKQFVVLHHLVNVSNPRIRSHSVVLGATA